MKFLETRLAYKNNEKPTIPPSSTEVITSTQKSLSAIKARVREYQKKLKELVRKRSDSKLSQKERNAAQEKLVNLVEKNRAMAAAEAKNMPVDRKNITSSLQTFTTEVNKQNSNQNNIYKIHYSSEVMKNIEKIALKTKNAYFANNLLHVVGKKAFKLTAIQYKEAKKKNRTLTISQLPQKKLEVTDVTINSVKISFDGKKETLSL